MGTCPGHPFLNLLDPLPNKMFEWKGLQLQPLSSRSLHTAGCTTGRPVAFDYRKVLEILCGLIILLSLRHSTGRRGLKPNSITDTKNSHWYDHGEFCLKACGLYYFFNVIRKKVLEAVQLINRKWTAKNQSTSRRVSQWSCPSIIIYWLVKFPPRCIGKAVVSEKWKD